VLSYAEEWGKTISRVARWVDFENSYKTMDTSFMESVWWGLKKTWDKGLIYEDRKVLLYCSRCETPISNFEVAMDNSYRDITEESVFVKFKLPARQRIVDWLTDENTYALAWTTTPWTLPGNTSLNIGGDITYVVVEQNGENYILAKDRLEVLEGDYEVKMECSARSLEGLIYEPLFPGVIADESGRAHKIYIADFVTTTDGTGIVHNAAMYGEDDYKLAKEKELPRVEMLDHKGQYMDMAPEHLRGVFFKDADPIVIKDLQEKNQLYKALPYTHSYPHCYRCGTPLFYNALPAWFINIQKLKPQLLEQNESINWYPEHLKHGRFKLGIENAPDWNISRNRYWATALPFWKCDNKDCKNVACIGSVSELIEKSTNFNEVYPDFNLSEINYDAGSHEQNLNQSEKFAKLDLHRPYIDQVKLKCDECEAPMTRIPEVIDCWVESGSMPFAELHYPFENQDLFKQRFPSDFVVEYIPQTRAWFYVMHVVSNIIFDRTPFKNVITTGTILAEDGTKMSKSKNNYPDPNLVIEKYGADALRFYLLTSPVINGEDINFSEKTISEISRKVNMMMYNVWSFYRMYNKETGASARPETSDVLDQWVLALLDQLIARVTKELDEYDTVKAGKLIVEFVNDLSTWYLRRSRDRIKQGDDSGKTALAVLQYVLVQTSKVLAPFMPYLSDFIYRDLTGGESVHLEDWPVASASGNETILSDMELARQIVTAGHALRKASNIAVSQPLRAVAARLQADIDLDQDLIKLILAELNVQEWDTSLVDKASIRPETIKTGEGEGRLQQAFLDIELTPELEAMGAARKLERQIQDMRKKAGLRVGELVDLYYTTTDEKMERALVELVDRKKTFVNQVQTSLEVEADYETQADIGGAVVWLGIVRV
jgi:isoleucyl-tRNA synthetase